MSDNNEIIEALEQGFRELAPPESGSGNSWAPEWTLNRLGQIESARQAIKSRFAELMSDLDKEQAGLLTYYKNIVRHETDLLLKSQRGKKKSVKFLTGTAGYRSTKGTFVINDFDKANRWAYDNLPFKDYLEAVAGANLEFVKRSLTPIELYHATTKLNTSQMNEVLEKTGELADGCEKIGGGDKFYLKPVVLMLPERNKNE